MSTYTRVNTGAIIIVRYLTMIVCSNVIGACKLQDGLLDLSLKRKVQVLFLISLTNQLQLQALFI